jgi:hypothetical protein
LYRDAGGNMLMGRKTCRLRVQVDVTVAQFRQTPVHETKTRSLIDTPQKKSTLSGTDDLRRSGDGSVHLHFGPEAPEGYEQNWLKTK